MHLHTQILKIFVTSDLAFVMLKALWLRSTNALRASDAVHFLFFSATSMYGAPLTRKKNAEFFNAALSNQGEERPMSECRGCRPDRRAGHRIAN